jgi:hypothetical protein
VDACIDALISVISSGGLVVDVGDEIVGEYVSTLGHAGKPGVGRAFVKWAWDHRFNAAKVKRVSITRATNGGLRRYEEFPDIEDLSRFDPKDQKFVAVALASGDSPSVLNAVDSDWWNHHAALQAAGVTVEFLCGPPKLRGKGV